MHPTALNIIPQDVQCIVLIIFMYKTQFNSATSHRQVSNRKTIQHPVLTLTCNGQCAHIWI